MVSTKTAGVRQSRPGGQARQEGQASQGGRSARTRARIADAVITVLAEAGSSRLTHRLVAAAAGVSLAATTYHYATKRDMIADAASRLLEGYAQSFRRAAARQRRGDGVSVDLNGFATRLLINATGRHRKSALAWCEIMLDAARSAEGHTLADSWFRELRAVWSDLAGAMPGDRGEQEVETAIDTMIGLLFITLPLDLTSARLSAVLTGGGDPAREWAPPSAPPVTEAPSPTRRTNKARETRERILGGAIDVLIAQGAGAITYNAVAAQSALTTAAPAYHFGSIEGLLKAAEAELFARSKGRYRDMVTSAQVTGEPLDVLADLTAAVFVREVTQHGRAAIAIYSIGLESSRRLELRPAVWDVIMDQTKAWKRRLELLVPEAGPLEAMRMQAVFIGKQVRALSTGSPLAHLALARGEFRSAIIANTK